MQGTRRRLGSRLYVVLYIAIVVAPLVTAAISSVQLFHPAGTVFEVEMRSTGGTAAQLFWTSTWAFSEQESSVVPLHQHPGQFERIRFPLPQRPLEFLRFDFLNGPGEVLIRSMRVLDREGRTVRTIDPILMAAMGQVESVSRVGDATRFVTTKDANDPMLLMRSHWMASVPQWHSLLFVTRFSLIWIALACVALMTTGFWFIASELRDGPFTTREALWLGALFLGSFVARLALADAYSMPVPFWDQWDGEAATLYLPFANDGLTWHVMFTLHNEHRIFFTRVLAVTLLDLNGQWDPLLQIAVNAGLHSATAVAIAAVLWLAAGRRWLPAITVILVLVFAPPFALENTLAGFQSAFYFLVMFSVFALWLMGTKRPGSAAWFFGWFCAFCAVFTVAGGILTAVAIGCLVVMRTLDRPREWKMALVNIAALAAVAAVAYAALSPPLAYHESLKAGSWLAFKVSFARNLAFPWITAPRSSVLLWLPLIAVVVFALTRRLRTTPLEQFSLALGAWVVIQCAALAYSRGVGGTAPASRYLDMLSFGFVVNSLAFLALSDARPGRGWRRALGVATVAWLAIGAYGIADLSRAVLAKDGRERSIWMQEYVRNVRQFIMTGDVARLVEKRGPYELPYHTPWMLAAWLEHPDVRHILPATVREPIALQARVDGSETFVRTTTPKDPLPVWDSYGTARAKARGRFESEPTRCDEFGRLRFEVAGAARDARMYLAVKDVNGRETPVRPGLGTGSGWVGVSVPCPADPFTVVAVDDSPTSWFAFRQPATIGWMSAAAESMIERWRILAALAVLVAAAAVWSTLRRDS